jgi:hypothetical protein
MGDGGIVVVLTDAEGESSRPIANPLPRAKASVAEEQNPPTRNIHNFLYRQPPPPTLF